MRISMAAMIVMALAQCEPDGITQPSEETGFGKGIPHVVACTELNEASGLVASRVNAGVFRSHNDSGGQNALFALDSSGRYLAELAIPGVKNRDWEDIAAGPGPEPGKQYLYIGDIGDNAARYERVTIYRVADPVLESTGTTSNLTAGAVEAIQLRYPDEAHDAETLLCDPITGDLYIVTKREKQASVYRARFPQDTSKTTVLEKVIEFPLTGLVSGDISPDGGRLLLKTYSTIFLWNITAGAPFENFSVQDAIRLPYEKEPQGESVAWDVSSGGYHTISEKSGRLPVYLYSYQPLEAAVPSK